MRILLRFGLLKRDLAFAQKSIILEAVSETLVFIPGLNPGSPVGGFLGASSQRDQGDFPIAEPVGFKIPLNLDKDLLPTLICRSSIRIKLGQSQPTCDALLRWTPPLSWTQVICEQHPLLLILLLDISLQNFSRRKICLAQHQQRGGDAAQKLCERAALSHLDTRAPGRRKLETPGRYLHTWISLGARFDQIEKGQRAVIGVPNRKREIMLRGPRRPMQDIS
jgi:hypothetical protein